MTILILTFYILTIWLLLNILYFSAKKTWFMVSAFVFMIVVILTRNEYTILGLNLKYIMLPKKPSLFIAFVLYRSMIYPIILVLFINIFISYDKIYQKALVLIAAFSILLFAEYIAVKIKLIQYVNWNLLYHSIFIVCYLLVAYVSYLVMYSLLKKVIQSW